MPITMSASLEPKEKLSEGEAYGRSAKVEAATKRKLNETYDRPIDGRIAIARALDYKKGWPRIGALGETGAGKTTFERAVIVAALETGKSDFVLCHDVKDMEPEYPESVQVRTPGDFKTRGFLEGEPLFVSFRGDPLADVECKVEEVALFSLELARKGRRDPAGKWVRMPHLLVIDELACATTEGRKGWTSPSALKAFEQGRKIGITLLWSTQSPRKCPLDSIAQSSSVAFFRLTGGDRNYLRSDAHELGELITDVLPELKDGCFVLHEKGISWDGTVYKLPARYVADLHAESAAVAAKLAESQQK